MMKSPRDFMSATPLAHGLLGALLLLQLVVVRALASVSDGRVFIAGRELRWACWFRQEFDFPCPTCGLTRSVLHALHGQTGAAWQLNPAGLFLVSGLVMLALALVFLEFQRQLRTPHSSGYVHGRIRIYTKLYAHLLIALLFAHWINEIATR